MFYSLFLHCMQLVFALKLNKTVDSVVNVINFWVLHRVRVQLILNKFPGEAGLDQRWAGDSLSLYVMLTMMMMANEKMQSLRYVRLASSGSPVTRVLALQLLYHHHHHHHHRPWPAFGRQGLVGSSGGYTYHGYTSHASPRACGAQLGLQLWLGETKQNKTKPLEPWTLNILTFQPSYHQAFQLSNLLFQPSNLPTFQPFNIQAFQPSNFLIF